MALLRSEDPELAANKRLVYDMYRIVLQGGHAERAHEFIAEGYIQHNPNAGAGPRGPDRLCQLIAPGARDQAGARPAADPFDGRGRLRSPPPSSAPRRTRRARPIISSWFDLYRIEDGKIAEHWDPMLKSDPKIDPNDKKIQLLRLLFRLGLQKRLVAANFCLRYGLIFQREELEICPPAH